MIKYLKLIKINMRYKGIIILLEIIIINTFDHTIISPFPHPYIGSIIQIEAKSDK